MVTIIGAKKLITNTRNSDAKFQTIKQENKIETTCEDTKHNHWD